jgi:hypothetical protein
MTTFPPNRRTLVALAALACALAALVGARPAPGDTVTPVVKLGPTTIVNGDAIVSGTIAAPNPTSATLTVNGHPLRIDVGGTFAGTVNLNGQRVLKLVVHTRAAGTTSTITIPLTTNIVGLGGVLSPQLLSGLERAGASIARPSGGFISVGGGPISVSGVVANRDELASLSVNGIDALSVLDPNGTFAISVPGTSREVTVVMTDRQGVSLETRYPAAAVVAYGPAANAIGIRIASVRYYTKRIRKTKRLRMVVKVKDRRGFVVRGARVTVRSVRSARVVGRAKVKRSNKKGQAGFVLRLRSKAFGKRLVMMATAKTPTAKASKRTSVRLPRRASR